MLHSKWKKLTAILVVIGAVGMGADFLPFLMAAPPAADPKETADVPSEREGRLVLVGTEVKPGETAAPKDLVKVEVGFLAYEEEGGADPNAQIKPEKWWADLDPTGKKVYARWKEGAPLPAGGLVVAHEEREYRKLRVGDAVGEGQLLAIVDEGPALEDLTDKIEDREAAEADYQAAAKTKEEAVHRASSAELLWSKGKGYISEDDYRAALLNRDRYVEEEKVRAVGRRRADRAVRAAAEGLKTCEVRSGDAGVVKEILKRRGEAVHAWDPIVRLEVAAAPVVNVPAQRDGVVLVVGREIKEGEKVPEDRVVVVQTDGEAKRYLRLREGDLVEEGELLARLDDRLARLDVEVTKDKLDAAQAALKVALRVREDAAQREQVMRKLGENGTASATDVIAAKLDLDRAEGDEQVKAAAVRQAEAELKAAETVLGMYEVRSPVRGVVRAVGKRPGEAVKALETIVQVEEKAKE